MTTWLATKSGAVDQAEGNLVFGSVPRKKWIVKEVLRQDGGVRMLTLY